MGSNHAPETCRPPKATRQQKRLTRRYKKLFEASPSSSPVSSSLEDAASLTRASLASTMLLPSLRRQMFCYVDLYPTLDPDLRPQVLQEHFQTAFPKLPVASSFFRPLQKPFSKIADRVVNDLAHLFVAATTVEETCALVERWNTSGLQATVDLLGEKTLTSTEADAYMQRVVTMITALASKPASSNLSVSVKPTALSPQLTSLKDTLGVEDAYRRLKTIGLLAQHYDVLLYLDMEHYEVKNLIIQLFVKLLNDPDLTNLRVGLVLQAYLRDTAKDLTKLLGKISLTRHHKPSIRLVKGAYWDQEYAQAISQNRPIPVFTDKTDTDTSYNNLAEMLLQHVDRVYPAFASHNVDTLAHVAAHAEDMELSSSLFEFQMLAGMSSPLDVRLHELGFNVRLYAPVGDLLQGMAYLVRRLLENTSQVGFVTQNRHRVLSSLAALLPQRSSTQTSSSISSVPGFDLADIAPTPDWTLASTQRSYLNITSYPSPEPALVDDLSKLTRIPCKSPSNEQTFVTLTPTASLEELCRPHVTWDEFASTSVVDRANLLRKTAGLLAHERTAFTRLIVEEVGKTFPEATMDVAEAIDFLNFYAASAESLAARKLISPPGEANHMFYRPRGLTAAISPWNFPVAIPTGMLAAALVTGNPVVFKPAEQSYATGAALCRLFHRAGIPHEVLRLALGDGSLGAALVRHPEVATIAFTGSLSVGQDIAAVAGTHRSRHGFKRLAAELGGKNFMIVDEYADPDQALPHIVQSAFSFAGQKCSALSRLILVGEARALLPRLLAMVDELVVNDPHHLSTDFGPLIEKESVNRLRRYRDLAVSENCVLLDKVDSFSHLPGFYAGPLVVAPSSRSALARDEIFAPALAVFPVDTFDEALALAADTDFGLTGSVQTRLNSRLDAARGLPVGNLYLNRNQVGAAVARQPFGGLRLSGSGFKAGGPDYLLQFVDTTVVSENLIRQGLVD